LGRRTQRFLLHPLALAMAPAEAVAAPQASDQSSVCFLSPKSMKTFKLESPEESSYFAIPDYSVEDQTGAGVDLFASLDFRQDIGASDSSGYPELTSIVSFVRDFLDTYPQEVFSWDVFNKDLVAALLTRDSLGTAGDPYPLGQWLEALTIYLQVDAGSPLISYPHESEVTGYLEDAGLEFEQSYSFSIPGYGLDREDGAILDLFVDLIFSEDVASGDSGEYPEFASLVKTIESYLLALRPEDGASWELLSSDLVASLLSQASVAASGVEYRLDQLVENLDLTLDRPQDSCLADFTRSSTITGSPGQTGSDYDHYVYLQIPAYGLDQQDGAILDVAVELDLNAKIVASRNEYPDFVAITDSIESYLDSLGNGFDFWGFLDNSWVNNLLTQAVPSAGDVEYDLSDLVDSLTVTLDAQTDLCPDDYPRSITVVGAPLFGSLGFGQSFSFSILDYCLDDRDGARVDISVELNFKGDVAIANPFDASEFASIVDRIKTFLDSYPKRTDPWEILNKNLVNALLAEAIPSASGGDYWLRELVNSITVDLDVKSSCSPLDYPYSSSVHQSVYVAGELIPIAADILAISSGDAAGPPTLEISLADYSGKSVYELAAFTVDDAQGGIDGLLPGAAGYAQAAVERAETVFSTLAHSPSGFDPHTLGRSMQFSNGDKLRFLLVKNNTLDSLRSGSIADADLLFADPSTQRITESGDGRLSLAWKDVNSGSSDFNDLVVTLQATDNELPLGASIQAEPEAEVLDLTSVLPDRSVQASFAIMREAAYNNTVCFYRVSNAQGSILDPITGDSLSPGDPGYTQLAVKNRVADLDLRTANQTTTRLDAVFQGGQILAPFIVVKGAVERLLDGDSSNDPAVFFPYLNANSDRKDHIRLLANNTFGFEDMPGGGDFDYNDIIVQVSIT
jgi:Domain of unknown function (DUF4114)